jgi:hypothetical protein
LGRDFNGRIPTCTPTLLGFLDGFAFVVITFSAQNQKKNYTQEENEKTENLLAALPPHPINGAGFLAPSFLKIMDFHKLSAEGKLNTIDPNLLTEKT